MQVLKVPANVYPQINPVAAKRAEYPPKLLAAVTSIANSFLMSTGIIVVSVSDNTEFSFDTPF